MDKVDDESSDSSQKTKAMYSTRGTDMITPYGPATTIQRQGM